VGAGALSEATGAEAAPLEVVARSFGAPGVRWVVALGAITAMLGVVLNLLLGLSRVLLAMGRRGDMPRAVARLTGGDHTTPWLAVLVVGALIGGLACIGSVKTTWSFSAFTVLVYYALTNASALRLGRQERLYHPAFAVCGLVGCLGLAFWVDARIWIAGLVLIGVGLVWRGVAQRLLRRAGRARHGASGPNA
jgi:APA family basic amino acid/polyamine antiporter